MNRNQWRILPGLLFCAAVLSFGGCYKTADKAPPPDTASHAVLPTGISTPFLAQNALPVTLPVLDAFFADSTFPTTLKDSLQLTNDQVTQLRQVARDETQKLNEQADTTDYTGTTTAARELAQQRIQEIIGPEKTARLADFIRNRWSGGAVAGAGADSTRPNHVPTDTRILVNIPAFRMDLFQNGSLVKSYRIAIGYPEFPLPTGMRKAEQIIFNPTWTPPDEPWVEGSNKVSPGQKIGAGDKLNPLGIMKIPIGLPSLIHGGKNASQIGHFGSHGCVGLTDNEAQEFLRLLASASGTDLPDTAIAAYEKNKTTTKPVKLTAPMQVELRYETIVVQDGALHIYRDVYDRGTNTLANLDSVLSAYGVTAAQLSDSERTRVTAALAMMSAGPTEKPSATDTAHLNDAPRDTAARQKSQTAHVTRTIKGQTEIVIPIAALRGKGYPVPVQSTTSPTFALAAVDSTGHGKTRSGRR